MVNMISQGKKRWTWSSLVTSPACSSSALLQYVVRWLTTKAMLSWQGKGWQNAMYSAKGRHTCTISFLMMSLWTKKERYNCITLDKFNNCIRLRQVIEFTHSHTRTADNCYRFVAKESHSAKYINVNWNLLTWTVHVHAILANVNFER